MTYSIIARCPRTGQFGIGIASYSIAIGIYCDGAVRANTGVTLTLGSPLPRNNYLAINLLAQGRTAGQALTELLANDPDSAYRQIALVDRESTAVAHTGASARKWAGHRIGKGYVAFGDMLAGQQVIDAVAAGFEAKPDAGMDEQLLAALEAGRNAGGMVGGKGRLPERSAAMVVWGDRTYNEVDLRVDLHDRAIEELRRIYVDYKPSIAYYEERARSPRNAIPAMEFADMLKKQQQKENDVTYSIIARCPRTGRFGVGSTTFSMACGRRSESVRPNVGISKSQAFYLRYVDPLALNMLEQGHTPQHIMRTLAAEDPDFDYRQFGIIDRENNVVAHTGPGCGKWAGHTVGPYHAAYGNGLAGPQTVAGIIAGFMKQPDAPLEDRLMLALEGGRDAGGQMSKGIPRPERSAWIRVVDRLDFPEIDVRVDLHDKTVAELRRILGEFKRFREYYGSRSTNPRDAMPEEEFVAGLNARAA